ncbi:hypothetical protein COCON_G00154600 [Conger conger]|uniref:Tektin n=1 Tax=Conger conger TaxID=82655 RepID=A0A9Q1HUZ7_CONCO|nr:tektin-1-like [Conger conger]KAJ8263003.1 hypothetical protein COCON_G00154600 [Conger conger]
MNEVPGWTPRGRSDCGHPERDQLLTQRVVAENQKLVDQSNKATERMQEDVKTKLAQRVQDVRMWRAEFYRKLSELLEEIEALQDLGTRLERAIESCSEARSITLQCLAERQNYVGEARDRVEGELMKDMELVERVISVLHSTLKQSNEQIRLNRSSKYLLERDLLDNFQAERIDSCVLNTPPKVLCAEEADLSPPGATVSPDDWNEFTNMKLSRLGQQRRTGLSLRAQAESMLDQMAADLRRQHQATGGVIEQSIQDNRKAKKEIEDSQANVQADAARMDKSMVSVRGTLEEKQGQLRAAQVQLAVRGQRPGIEQCQDAAQLQLLALGQELSAYISRLSERFSQAEVELRCLNTKYIFLEEQVQMRSYALNMDEATYVLLQQKANAFQF